MIKVPVNELKGYLDSVFTAEDSQNIYKFYRNCLALGKNDTTEKAKAGFQRKKYESSTSRQLKHVKYLVDDYGSDAVLSAYKIFKDKLEHGEIDNPTIQYFAGFVKNEAARLAKQDSSKDIKNVEVIPVISVIPIPLKYADDPINNPPSPVTNWDFTCPKCKSTVWGGVEKCPECSSVFDWQSVDVSKLS